VVLVDIQLAEEVTEQYNADEPVPETNRKSHSQSDSKPASVSNRKLQHEVAPRPPIS